MSISAVDDLIGQFKHAFGVFYEEVARFSDDQWVTGFEFFQVPVKQGMHLLECLEFYFADKSLEGYRWGSRFGGGWWELKDEQLPDKDSVLVYAKELEEKVMSALSNLDDDDLLKPINPAREWGTTLSGHYNYALRHTAHHQGQLAALASFHGYEGGSWDL